MEEAEENGSDKEELNEGQQQPSEGIQEQESDFEKLNATAMEYKDKYFRSLAEMENLRKRLQKERQELVQYAIQNVMLDFLAPIDQMEMALKFTDQASSEVKHWAMGFQMILGQFKDALASNGVKPFTAVGQPFDHSCHEAVEMVETAEYPPGTVVEESMRGYKMNGDKILRPARVKVSKAPAPEGSPTAVTADGEELKNETME
jgi:molecular chaperone GrpE